MKLNKYALVLFLGLGTLTSCNDNLELLNPNQQTSNTFGFNADDLEESVIAAFRSSKGRYHTCDEFQASSPRHTSMV